jgi:hypothetical protein
MDALQVRNFGFHGICERIVSGVLIGEERIAADGWNDFAV